MKSLQTIQTLSKIGMVLSKIAFIFSIIGAVGFVVGMAGRYGTKSDNFSFRFLWE